MTRGRKTGGRDFQPGVAPNPTGRPRLPDHLKKANLETQNSKRTLQYLLSLSYEQLVEYAAKPITVFELMWAKQLIDAIEKGDTAKLNLALERSEGKVPNVNQNEDITGRDKDLEQIPREALIELVKKA